MTILGNRGTVLSKRHQGQDLIDTRGNGTRGFITGEITLLSDIDLLHMGRVMNHIYSMLFLNEKKAQYVLSICQIVVISIRCFCW